MLYKKLPWWVSWAWGTIYYRCGEKEPGEDIASQRSVKKDASYDGKIVAILNQSFLLWFLLYRPCGISLCAFSWVIWVWNGWFQPQDCWNRGTLSPSINSWRWHSAQVFFLNSASLQEALLCLVSRVNWQQKNDVIHHIPHWGIVGVVCGHPTGGILTHKPTFLKRAFLCNSVT